MNELAFLLLCFLVVPILMAALACVLAILWIIYWACFLLGAAVMAAIVGMVRVVWRAR